MSVLDGMCRLLAAAGVGTYSPDAALPAGATPIGAVAFPSTKGDAVCVTTYAGGPEPDSREGDEYPRMQVRVRARNPLDAIALDRQAFDALQFRPGTTRTLPETPEWLLSDCHALQSEPQPLGVDDNGRHEFVRNYQLTVTPV